MRNVVVVDTSIAIKWVLNEHDSKSALALLTEWTERGVVMLAPALLSYEATNTLYRHTRSGKISFDDAKRGLKEVILTVLELDSSQDAALNVRAMELAQLLGVPAAYDAHYLALAEREDCECWTADTKIWKAARSQFPRVRWMGDYQPAS